MAGLPQDAGGDRHQGQAFRSALRGTVSQQGLGPAMAAPGMG